MDLEIDTANCSIELCDGNYEEVMQIILNNIGIQISMADILLEDNDGDFEDTVSYIGIANDGTSDNQLDKIKKCFCGVHRLYDSNNELVVCEVYKPRAIAIQAFTDALDRGLLNEWIKIFFFKENAADCNQIGLYRYIPDKGHNVEDSLIIKTDIFFDYLMNGNQNYVIQPGIRISNFALDEIETVPYINELYSLVDNLYVLVSQSMDQGGNITFKKYLTWDRVVSDS
jgi:hypothetical protein